MERIIWIITGLSAIVAISLSLAITYFPNTATSGGKRIANATMPIATDKVFPKIMLKQKQTIGTKKPPSKGYITGN